MILRKEELIQDAIQNQKDIRISKNKNSRTFWEKTSKNIQELTFSPIEENPNHFKVTPYPFIQSPLNLKWAFDCIGGVKKFKKKRI